MRTVITIILVFLSAVVHSQNYYYSSAQQIPFTNDQNSIIVIVNDTSHYNGIVLNIETAFNISADSIILAEERNCIMVNSSCFKTIPFVKIADSISVSNNDIKYISYSKRENTSNERFWITDEVLIKIAKDFSINDVIPLLASYNYDVIFNEYGNWYSIKCFTETDVLSIANALYSSQYVEFSHPNLYSQTSVYTNDPLFNYQFYLKNTGQYISDCENTGELGINDIDINVVPAWDLTQGSSNLRIAVIDDGVEAHEDLKTSGGASRVLQGFTPGCIFACDGRPRQYGRHGQCCAGIIAASHNNIGIAGVAPLCNIVPIRVIDGGNELFSVKNIAKAINKSWSEYNCDILSNSWKPPYLNIDNITDAFCEASIHGRNNKGCVIVASSGNDFSSSSPYAQILPSSAIIVGAVTNKGLRATYSNFGYYLSVVAPSNKTGYANVRTIDREGDKGYNLTGNYTNCFSGTSASCPQVSGVAALMLSVNPNLTAIQVRDIIEQTAQRIRPVIFPYSDNPLVHPNGEWQDYVGYGLVDAHAAVMQAYFYNYTVNGTNTSLSPCSEYTYSLSNSTIPNGVSFSWDVSNNLEIVSEQGTSITVRPIGYGACWVKANFTHEGYTVTKTKNTIVTSGYTSTIYKNYTASGTTPITIDPDAVISGPFTISSGSTVTISTTVHCSPSVEFFIQPGGKLVVDGGTITNLCPDKMWRSIRVVGNSSLRQLAQNQGTLEIKNGSVIENAIDAISTWDGEDYNKTGGIVRCTSSTFLNNKRSAEFLAYTYHLSSGTEILNVSYFKDCDFIVNDNNIFAASNTNYNNMITMWGVNGVDIRGCHFSDTRTGSPTRGNAITLASAGAKVRPYCPPNNDYTLYVPCECSGESRTTFNGFSKGVNAENTGTNYPFEVFKSNFDNCQYSVYASGVNNYSATMSDIDVPVMGQNTNAYGIYSSNCTGYTIEANDFYGDNNVNYYTYGTYVTNSGSDANTIYRNSYDKLMYGIYSDNNPALQILCNEFTNGSVTDILAYGTIGAQGSSDKSAGNKFSSGITNFSSNNNVAYYHSDAINLSNVYCPYNSTSTVTKYPNITANDCEPTICLGIPSVPSNPPGPKSTPENDDITLYESLQQMYNTRLAEYNAAGYEFLLQNFDENDVDIVAIARLKQDTLISLSRVMAEIANRNINAILGDSILDRETLNGWYCRINTTTAKYSLVNSYFETGNYSLANQELASIPQRFTLSSEELAEYNNFCTYNTLRESVYTSGRNYAQLTADEIAELEDIADLSTGVSSAYANSVLCFFYGICREIEEPEMDDTPMNNKNAVANVDENETESLAVYVYPNPADEELNILLNSMPQGTTIVEFHDVTGRLVLSEEIKSANTSINISSLKQGVYMYRILNGDNVIARDRIVKE